MSFSIKLDPSREFFESKVGDTILEAALAANKNIPHSCSNGDCGECKAKLISGKVKQERKPGLSEEEARDGYILTCASVAQGDINIEVDYLPELSNISEIVTPCKVESFHYPDVDIAIVFLRLPPNAPLEYIPGQFINLIKNSDQRSYSIANVMSESKILELHIRRVDGGLFSDFIFNNLNVGDLLRLRGPLGTFFIRESDRPIILLAGGTGFAPVKAMVELLMKQKTKRQVLVYWGASKSEHLYSKEPYEWAEDNENISFIPVVSGHQNEWKGRVGLVHQAVLDDIRFLNDFDVYACGSPEMIAIAKANFLDNGLRKECFYSDAFIPFK